jgi:hypothetical protein
VGALGGHTAHQAIVLAAVAAAAAAAGTIATVKLTDEIGVSGNAVFRGPPPPSLWGYSHAAACDTVSVLAVLPDWPHLLPHSEASRRPTSGIMTATRLSLMLSNTPVPCQGSINPLLNTMLLEAAISRPPHSIVAQSRLRGWTPQVLLQLARAACKSKGSDQYRSCTAATAGEQQKRQEWTPAETGDISSSRQLQRALQHGHRAH